MMNHRLMLVDRLATGVRGVTISTLQPKPSEGAFAVEIKQN